MTDYNKKPSAKQKESKGNDTSVTVRDIPLGEKFRKGFAIKDVEGIANNVVLNVIQPACKKLIFDTVVTALKGWLYPGGSPQVSSNGTAYNWTSSTTQTKSNSVVKTMNLNDEYKNLVCSDPDKAQMAWDLMFELLDRNGCVRIADLYSLLDRPIPEGAYTYNNFGWTDLSRAVRRPMADGIWFDMPKAIPVMPKNL